MKKVLTILSALIILSTMGYSQTLRFDFGPKGSDVAEGFIGLGPDVYSEETGYGFEPGVLISEVSNKKGDALSRDYVTASDPFRQE
ncbi:MAG: hypothetical protein II205_04695 [Bacteroidales bacterium]|nr:hypothetical protein [Bacteroidales bacterium]